VIGCLSLLAEACPDLPERAAWRLRGMAVRRDSHRRGIGSALIAAAAAAAGQQRIDLIWCNARTSALPFYRAVGWRAIGEEFLTDTGIPHYRALLDLAGFDPSGRVVG
jgi:GNAT superfamily N-acetyltransferase